MKKFKIAGIDEIREGSGKSVSLFGRRYAVFNIRGTFYGIDGSCKHMKASLAAGNIVGEIVTCAMHGWQYNIRTGECLTESWATLKTYPVEIIDDEIYINLE